MMALIDNNSESISEGDYLKLCNFMKQVHQALPRKVAAPSAPFQPIQRPPAPSQPIQRSPDVARRASIEGTLNHVKTQIRDLRHRMKLLKIRQRITDGVRRDAIRDAANRMGVRIRTLTLDALREKGAIIPHAHMFYKEYMERTNEANRPRLEDMQNTLIQLEGREVGLLDQLRVFRE